MGFDPISLAVTILAIYGMLQRNPDWSGGLLQEWQASRRGEESEAAKALRQKLTDAGVAPSERGGPLRRHLSNMWRDYWTDRDRRHQSERADRLADEAEQDAQSWRDRLGRRLDEVAARKVQGWKVAPPADPPEPDDSAAEPAKTPETLSGDAATDPKSADPTSPAAERGDTTGPNSGGGRWESTTVHDDDTYTTWPGPHPGPPPATSSEDREPIRVDATVGDPIRPETSTMPAAPVAAITAGGTTMTAVATAQTAVTGVVSGAAEARAIAAAAEQATAEYMATLNRLRGRIQSMGEQTLGTVQMSGRSHVIANTAAAAEAMAAAVANARACTSEVTPLLGDVARAFDRVNS